MHDFEDPGPIHIIIIHCIEEDFTIITPLQPNAQPQQEKDFNAACIIYELMSSQIGLF